MKAEARLSQQISDYMRAQYPNVIYQFDLSSGGVQSIGMAMRNKRLNKWRGMPDLFIAKPSGIWHGMYIELKATDIFKKDGTLKKSDHLSEQREMMHKLQSEGYKCVWGIGFEDTINKINNYLLISKTK